MWLDEKRWRDLTCVLDSNPRGIAVSADQAVSADPDPNVHTGERYVELVSQLVGKLGDIAAKGTVRFLLGFGGLVIILAFVTKLSIPSLHINTLTQPVEFVAMLLVGLVIMLSGAVVACQPAQRSVEILEKAKPSPTTAPPDKSPAGGTPTPEA
jgi:hypothetical protein